jgi:hypothetical protein
LLLFEIVDHWFESGVKHLQTGFFLSVGRFFFRSFLSVAREPAGLGELGNQQQEKSCGFVASRTNNHHLGCSLATLEGAIVVLLLMPHGPIAVSIVGTVWFGMVCAVFSSSSYPHHHSLVHPSFSHPSSVKTTCVCLLLPSFLLLFPFDFVVRPLPWSSLVLVLISCYRQNIISWLLACVAQRLLLVTSFLLLAFLASSSSCCCARLAHHRVFHRGR